MKFLYEFDVKNSDIIVASVGFHVPFFLSMVPSKVHLITMSLCAKILIGVSLRGIFWRLLFWRLQRYWYIHIGYL